MQSGTVEIETPFGPEALSESGIVGRGHFCRIRIEDARVSEAHALVTFREGAWHLLALRGPIFVDVGGRLREEDAVALDPGTTVWLEPDRTSTLKLSVSSSGAAAEAVAPTRSGRVLRLHAHVDDLWCTVEVGGKSTSVPNIHGRILWTLGKRASNGDNTLIRKSDLAELTVKRGAIEKNVSNKLPELRAILERAGWPDLLDGSVKAKLRLNLRLSDRVEVAE